MKQTYIIRDPDTGNLAAAIADLVRWPKEDSKNYIITRINVMEQYRGQGFGRQILNEILSDADKEGVVLFLEPSASGGLSKQELEEWYERNGFTWGAWHMRRRPQN
jgi:GNAT superfamily N-acetyltransferase